MAILLRGKTVCPLCGKTIVAGEGSVAFPAFVDNGLDPLQFFSDSAFHTACFLDNPLSNEVKARYAELKAKSPPSNIDCRICGRKISSPDEYVGLGHLTDDTSEPIHELNYAQFHRACLDTSPQLRRICSLIKGFRDSGKWKGPKLSQLLAEFCQ
jgi:hypothetical protein